MTQSLCFWASEIYPGLRYNVCLYGIWSGFQRLKTNNRELKTNNRERKSNNPGLKIGSCPDLRKSMPDTGHLSVLDSMKRGRGRGRVLSDFFFRQTAWNALSGTVASPELR